MPSAVGPRPAVAASRTLAEVAARLGTPAPAGSADVAVSGTTLDSRAVRPGDLYAALPGARTHGARFAAQAVAAGAVAVLTDDSGAGDAAAAGVPALVVPDPRAVLGDLAAWLYGNPAEALTLIGITGTNGKTTTAYLVEAGLRAAGRATGLIGTVETRIGEDVLPSARTTPEAPDLQALFAVMRERGVDAAVMEVSSHALAQGRVDGTVYDVAVFTNLSQDHLDFHGDLEDYFAAKAQLFSAARSRRAVVDIDDVYGARLAGEAGVPVTTVSPSGAGADWSCEDVVVEPAGSRFVLRGPDGAGVDCAVRLPGDFNVANAALAIVALACAGVDVRTAATGVASRAGVPGRMERVDAGQPFLAVVDYAHTPDAVAVAVAAVRPGLTGRVLVVLGCGGDRDRAKRGMMGEVAARAADVLIVTDDNPRSEDPAEIRAAMLAGAAAVPSGERADVHEVGSRRDAIGLAVRLAAPGDAVLVLGKGHEQGQEVGTTVHPFSDRAVLAEALTGVGDGGELAGR